MPHRTPPSRLFKTTKRQRCVKNVVTVDPNRYGFDRLGSLVYPRDIACPDAGLDSIGRVVGPGNQITYVGKWHRGHNRSKDFLANHFQLFVGIDQDCGFNKAAIALW